MNFDWMINHIGRASFRRLLTTDCSATATRRRPAGTIRWASWRCATPSARGACSGWARMGPETKRAALQLANSTVEELHTHLRQAPFGGPSKSS